MSDTWGKEIDLANLKKIELGILRQIHAVCQKEAIRYSLCGGTLLGAVRHGGFIPWDDDIDIFMPRPDYNRFIAYCKENQTPFRLVSSETEPKYGYLFAKAVNPDTVIREINGNRGRLPFGVCVDVFPIDGLGDTYEEAKKRFGKTRFKRELLVAYNWKRFFRSKTHSFVYEPIRFAFFLLSRFANPLKLIGRIQAAYPPEDFEKSGYAGTVCGSYRLKEILPKTVYSEFEMTDFEGERFCAIRDKETYLKSIYGDYMKLPPPEKRVTHHTFDAYYKASE